MWELASDYNKAERQKGRMAEREKAFPAFLPSCLAAY
jgi:hypothetical protein